MSPHTQPTGKQPAPLRSRIAAQINNLRAQDRQLHEARIQRTLDHLEAYDERRKVRPTKAQVDAMVLRADYSFDPEFEVLHQKRREVHQWITRYEDLARLLRPLPADPAPVHLAGIEDLYRHFRKIYDAARKGKRPGWVCSDGVFAAPASLTPCPMKVDVQFTMYCPAVSDVTTWTIAPQAEELAGIVTRACAVMCAKPGQAEDLDLLALVNDVHDLVRAALEHTVHTAGAQAADTVLSGWEVQSSTRPAPLDQPAAFKAAVEQKVHAGGRFTVPFVLKTIEACDRVAEAITTPEQQQAEVDGWGRSGSGHVTDLLDSACVALAFLQNWLVGPDRLLCSLIPVLHGKPEPLDAMPIVDKAHTELRDELREVCIARGRESPDSSDFAGWVRDYR